MTNNKKVIPSEYEKTRILIDTGVITFKDRLILVLEGLSGNAFAKKVGMSEAVIRDYLSGKTYPSLNRLAMIAQKCDIPIEWLATGKGKCRLLPETEQKGCVYIPIYNLNDCDPAVSVIEQIPFDISWMKHRGFQADDLMAIWVKGDSMEPTVSNHDIIIVNKSHNKPLDGYLYAVQYDDQLSIKRIQNQGYNLALLSDNTKYPIIIISKSEMQNLKILGFVVYILKDLH
ncbi:XRE family transcriptional regulator [Orbaceae bacterium ESL0727]|nr:XRE family transcriptional regulator [Orbaceae bacterium ESL0727]